MLPKRGLKSARRFRHGRGHLHGKTVLAFVYLKPGMAMHPREKAPSQQLDPSLVRLTAPDKHSRSHPIFPGVSNRYSMGHVFRGQTEGAGDTLWPQTLHAN